MFFKKKKKEGEETEEIDEETEEKGYEQKNQPLTGAGFLLSYFTNF